MANDSLPNGPMATMLRLPLLRLACFSRSAPVNARLQPWTSSHTLVVTPIAFRWLMNSLVAVAGDMSGAMSRGTWIGIGHHSRLMVAAAAALAG